MFGDLQEGLHNVPVLLASWPWGDRVSKNPASSCERHGAAAWQERC